MWHVALDEFYPYRWLEWALRFRLPLAVLGERRMEELGFWRVLGYKPNFDNPTTINEKLCWLKLHDHRDFCTMAVDKYRVRDYIAENFGTDILVPLVGKLDSWRDIRREVFPDYPTIIKCNSGSKTWQIIRDPDTVDYDELRNRAHIWMGLNYYYKQREWGYKNVKPCLIIEKLLTMPDGKVPEDVKLHFFNGKCGMVYKVIDREGENYRAFFTPEWELLPFQYVSRENRKETTPTVNEPRPQCLDDMIAIGTEIAKNFKYVRVDFYDMGDKFYFSEITLLHGAGYNAFYPSEYGDKYAEMLDLQS